MANVEIGVGQKRKHRAARAVENVKRVRCGSSSEDDCWVSPGNASSEATALLQELLELLKQKNLADFSNATDEYIRLLDTQLDDSASTKETYFQYAILFENTFKDINNASEVLTFLKWIIFFTQRAVASDCTTTAVLRLVTNPPELLSDLMATLYRFVAQKVAPLVLSQKATMTIPSPSSSPAGGCAKRRLPGRRRATTPSERPVIGSSFPLDSAAAKLFTEFLQRIEILRRSSRLNDSEISYLLRIVQNLYLINPTEVSAASQNSSAELTRLQYTAECMLIDQSSQSESRVNEIMVMISSDILDRDVYVDDNVVTGPQRRTPDGLSILRCASLLLRFVMNAGTHEEFQSSSGTPDTSSITRHYQDLPSWSTRMTPSKWSLESLQGRWEKIRGACRALAVTLMGHLNWKASLAKASDAAALPLKRRVALMKQIISDVGDAVLSPWYPAAPCFLISLCDNLIRMAYDTQKSVALNQALLELVQHAFATLAKESQSIEVILPMVGGSTLPPDICACGAYISEENVEVCPSCHKRFHPECYPCEDCVLSKLSRECGAMWLEDFCLCFKPSSIMGTLTRRFPGSSQSSSMPPEALPEVLLSLPWKEWVIISKFVCLAGEPDDALLRALLSFCAAQCLPAQSDSQPEDRALPAVEETPVMRKKAPAALEPPPRRRRKSRVVAERVNLKKDSSATVKSEPEIEVVISPTVRIGVPFDDCARELLSFTFGLSECYWEDGILASTLAQRSVPELQLHIVLKVWSLALRESGFVNQIRETAGLLLRVVGAKLMTSIMNSQTVGVKTAESLIDTLTSLITCLPSRILETFSSDLRSLYEDIFRNTKLKFSTRRCLVLNLNKILVTALEASDESLLWNSLQSERKGVFSNVTVMTQSVARTPVRTPSNHHKVRRTTLASSKYRGSHPTTELPNSRSEQSELSLFLLWITQLCLSIPHPIPTIRLEIWKLLSIVLFALPFKSTTYRLVLERLINQLSEEESLPLRSLLLKTILYLFFSSDAVNLALSWQRAHSEPIESSDLVAPSGQTSMATPSAALSHSTSSTEELEDIDISDWPVHFQWIGILVMIISFTERKRLTIRADDGSEKPLLDCCLSNDICDTAVMQKLIQLLIDFFVYVRSLRHNNVARFFQRCTLKLVTILAKSHPRILLQIVPFALPYVCEIPTTQTDAQLAAQVCPLLESAIEIDKGILGSAENVRREVQPALFRLTRVRGPLGALATRLLVIIVRNVTQDFVDVLVPLVAKDLNLISRALQRHKLLRQDSREECLNLSPLFHPNNVDKLRHSFEKIAAVVDVIDFPATIEDEYLTLEQVAQWFETETSAATITRADAVPIVIYDLFCDIYLEYRELRHSPELAQDRRLVRLELELMSSVVLVLGNLANFYREFIRSSRLTLIFTDALESQSVVLNNQALLSIIALFKAPLQTGSRVPLARRCISRPSTPTSVPATGCGTRSLQPLCVQVPTVCKLLRNLEVPYVIPLLDDDDSVAEAASKASRICVKCRLNALALFHEMIAQGFVTPSDMFETITACILLGDPEIESEAANLAALCLANAPNPAAILRRKASAIMMGFHRFAAQRLRYCTEVTRKAVAWEDVNFDAYTRPFANWLDRVIRPKPICFNAFMEGLLVAIAKVYSLSEVSTQLGSINRSLSSIPSQTILEVFEFTKSYVLYTASFVLSIPLSHTGELRQVILNLQSLVSTYASNLSLDIDSNGLDLHTSVDEEIDVMHLGDDMPSSAWNLMDQLHKSIARKIISLAVHLLITAYIEAYHIDEQMKVCLQKRPKDSDLKHFNLVRGHPDMKPYDVNVEDLRLALQLFNERICSLQEVFSQFHLRKEKDMSLFQEIRVAVENTDILEGISAPMLITTSAHAVSSPTLDTTESHAQDDEE